MEEKEEEPATPKWLDCPSSVKAVLPKKIKIAVGMALDECFLEIVGTPDAQRDKWVYKEIKKRICAEMRGWVEEAIDDAIVEELKDK